MSETQIKPAAEQLAPNLPDGWSLVHLNDFDFHLPRSCIALRPASPRDSAKLLVVNPNLDEIFAEGSVRDLPGFLRAGDVIVFNNTKVLPAELCGRRPSRGNGSPDVEIHLNLVERRTDGTWRALARPSRRLRVGDHIVFNKGDGSSHLIIAAKGEEGEVYVASSVGNAVEEVMQRLGAMPLPPYIARARPVDQKDRADYQTVYACVEGAVAAPTAGLHFTPELMDDLSRKGVQSAFVTLHVGQGTFSPFKSERAEDHTLHSEWCEVSGEAANIINECRVRGGRLVVVGTTSLRLLETAANADGLIEAYRGFTNIFIKPGYRFKSADLLLTNFHLPKSTLFMLVCAFSGTKLMKRAYDHAVAKGFRFYSYGDACLLFRDKIGSA